MHEVKYIRPKSLADAVQTYRTTPGCRPLAGGTDLMVMLPARTVRPEPRAVLDLWSLAELKGVRRVQDMVEIGAAESYTGIIASRDVQQHLSALAAAARTIGAAQIQNRGTLGGNLANASPAGDTLPVLLAYDAVVVTDRRSIPDRKSTRLNSSHLGISYAVFCLKKKIQSELLYLLSDD